MAEIRPLLVGYVLTRQDRPVFDIREWRIAYVSVKGTPLIVADSDVERLRETEARMLERPSAPIIPRVGNKIVIIVGAFLGRQGVIERSCRGKSYVVAMGRGITARLRRCDLALVSG